MKDECNAISPYSLCALVECPDGGIERVDSLANVVREGRDLLAQDGLGQGRLNKVCEVSHLFEG